MPKVTYFGLLSTFVNAREDWQPVPKKNYYVYITIVSIN